MKKLMLTSLQLICVFFYVTVTFATIKENLPPHHWSRRQAVKALADAGEPAAQYIMAEYNSVENKRVALDYAKKTLGMHQGGERFIGNYYLHGYGGLKKNINKALAYYQQGAIAGDLRAVESIGKLYAFYSTRTNAELLAELYFNKVVNSTTVNTLDGTSQAFLAIRHHQYKKAYKLGTFPAKLGDSEALYLLAGLLQKGLGVKKDLIKSYLMVMYVDKHAPFLKNTLLLKELKSKLSPEQLKKSREIRHYTTWTSTGNVPFL